MPKKNAAERAVVPRSKKTRAKKVKSVNVPALPDLPSNDFIPEDLGVDMPDPRSFLSDMQQDGSVFEAAEIYKDTWLWLKGQGCAKAVSKALIERYAVSTARWIQCEKRTSSLGFLSKHPTSGKPVSSPFVDMGLAYMTQSMKLWDEINQIVKDNRASKSDPEDDKPDILGKLL